jgi:hypothetical protein
MPESSRRRPPLRWEPSGADAPRGGVRTASAPTAPFPGAASRADLACDGPMAMATQALAERVKTGERIVCMCWCWPKPYHGTLIIDEIKRRLE